MMGDMWLAVFVGMDIVIESAHDGQSDQSEKEVDTDQNVIIHLHLKPKFPMPSLE
jgi:hypothetical protein